MGSVARFPKLDECAHFHYEHVELGKLEVSISGTEEQQPTGNFAVRVTSGDACWTLQRTYENFVMFDKQLHRCIFDRNFSKLSELAEPQQDSSLREHEEPEIVEAERLREYLRRFSVLNHEGLNCGPVLNWLQLDNRGRRILVPEADSCPINTPAVAAAYAVRPYHAQAQDEISFQVGDMISVIDMPPAGESTWWRGKHGFAVGFFPAECVAVIGDKLPRHLAISAVVQQQSVPRAQPMRLQPVKPVLRKHGKLIAFFRSFILNRPSRRRLKQSGILRERVFGCDLGEHLLNSSRDVPRVLSCCAEFIERYGLVDGIYRLSGVTSNIQRLRHAFDEDRVPALHSDESILQDIHSVASLLKMYFRELPNPLCTYQLYSTFVAAVQSASDTERLERMRDAVRKLPPPHYRTLEYLMRHLVRVAARGDETGMTPRNVAIVWAPNLLRCKELEVGGVAALQGVGVQAVVTEFLICYAELIFAPGPSDSSQFPIATSVSSGINAAQRPKSLSLAGRSARLLSLEEARNRSLLAEPELIEVGAGSAGLPPHYHTVIELPQTQRKRNGSKRSPSLNWRSLFSSKTTGPARQSAKTRTTSIEPAPVLKTTALATPIGAVSGSSRAQDLPRLRPAKSADSLEGIQEDGLGPLLGPSAVRTCGHSRSVSHDSYFEHLGDGSSGPNAPSVASPLDLSEIHLSFELEEREMHMLSGDESARQSLEASPRRQRSSAPIGSANSIITSTTESSCIDEGQVVGTAAGILNSSGGGSKRKRSRLEERLHCDLELRFIDSQSPDQVMISADVHEMETPSPLTTPGYLPLLSESSTPLTPTTSPATTGVSPRISFKSFLLPLDVGEPLGSPTKDFIDKNPLVNARCSEASREQGSSSSIDLNCSGTSLLIEQNNVMEACEEVETATERSASNDTQQSAFASASSDIVDQEMTSCERLLDLDASNEMNETTCHGLNVSPNLSNALHQSEQRKSLESSLDNQNQATDAATTKQQAPSSQNNNLIKLKPVTDLDSLMPYEHCFEPTQDSTFISINSSDKALNDVTLPNYSKKLSTEKWSSDIPSDSVIPSTTVDENKKKRISDSKVMQILSADQNSVNSNNSKNRQETGFHTASEQSYCIEKNKESANDHDSLCQKNSCNVLQTKDSNQLDKTNLLTLTPFETNLFSVNHGLRNNQSSCENSVCEINANTKTITNYQNKIENQISWNSFLSDKNIPKVNQNIKDKSTESQDQNNQLINKEKCENVQTIDLVLNQQTAAIENNVCIKLQDSEEIHNKSNQQISNSNNICNLLDEYHQTLVKQKSNNSNNVQNTRIKDDLEVVIPSESAAVEPQEMAHVPEMLSEGNALNSSQTFSSSSNTNFERDSVTHKDTATILQELALQRLSGGDKIESISTRRRYDSDFARDRRSFDSEIGREIVREHKIKQELENARGRTDESLTSSHSQTALTAHLPPCLRARHARNTRSTLSRSLDEAKFNKMTSSCEGVGVVNCSRQNKVESTQQHGSTPNIDGKANSQLGISERSTQSLNKNLGLDLDDPRCRERIEKYKEERRTFLRDKYRSESFRASASPPIAIDTTSNKQDEEQALLARLKQRASRPSLL